MTSNKPHSDISIQADAQGGQVCLTLPVLLPQEPGQNNVYGDLLTHLRLAEQWVAWLHLQMFVQEMGRFWPEELAGVRLSVETTRNGKHLLAYGTAVDIPENTEENDQFEGILETFQANLDGNVDLENPELVAYLGRMFPANDPTNEFVARDELFHRALASLPEALAIRVRAQALEQRLDGAEPSKRGPRL